MGDYFAAQAIAIAAGRKYAQSEASEKIRPKGVVKRKGKGALAHNRAVQMVMHHLHAASCEPEGLGHGLQHGLLSGWGVGPAGATKIAGAGAVWLCDGLLRRARAPKEGPM
jgi:hypothetical protein